MDRTATVEVVLYFWSSSGSLPWYKYGVSSFTLNTLNRGHKNATLINKSVIVQIDKKIFFW